MNSPDDLHIFFHGTTIVAGEIASCLCVFAARRLPAARRCFREPRIGALGARPGVLTEKTEWSETSSGFLSEAQATGERGMERGWLLGENGGDVWQV